MNLLVLPSWYPHRCYPLEGIYIPDQAKAIAEMHPDWHVGLSLWAQGEGALSLRHLLKSPTCVANALRSGGGIDLGPWPPNVRTWRSPVLTWSDRRFGGNRGGVLAANRVNLSRAQDAFGRIDLIHAHGSYPAGWVALQLERETGIPFVITEHMGPFPLPVYEQRDKTTLRPSLREPLMRARARIAVGPVLAERMAGFGVPRPEFVPNLVDERLYAVRPTSPSESFTFFTLCGMEKGKGMPDLLAAIARLLPGLSEAQRARVRFRVGGEGPELNRLREEAAALGLSPWVTWLGLLPRERARSEFEACDAFVLASHHESFGIVFVEAMACGKPVIATRCGGPEYIVTEETGVLIQVGDVSGLSTAMAGMVSRARGWDANRIRSLFEANYSRSAVVARLDAIYADALRAGELGARERIS
jgi:glycosyltransferase involved in cell wall biosynthesis